jgi:hypothetical protein
MATSRFSEILRWARGDRTEGLLEPGRRATRGRTQLPDDGLRQLADDLGLPYHDGALQRDAAEREWRDGNPHARS